MRARNFRDPHSDIVSWVTTFCVTPLCVHMHMNQWRNNRVGGLRLRFGLRPQNFQQKFFGSGHPVDSYLQQPTSLKIPRVTSPPRSHEKFCGPQLQGREILRPQPGFTKNCMNLTKLSKNFQKLHQINVFSDPVRPLQACGPGLPPPLAPRLLRVCPCGLQVFGARGRRPRRPYGRYA